MRGKMILDDLIYGAVIMGLILAIGTVTAFALLAMKLVRGGP